MEFLTQNKNKNKNKNKKKNKKRNKNKSQKGSGMSMSANSCIMNYAKTLTEPFKYGPCRLGWGNQGETQLATATARGTFSIPVSTDFLAFLLPDPAYYGAASATGIFAPLTYYSVASASPLSAVPAGGIGFSNANILNASCAGIRVVSAGIRLIPLLPTSTVPLVAYIRNVPQQETKAWAQGSTVGQIVSQPQFTSTVLGYNSVINMSWRPSDAASFDFQDFGSNGTDNVFGTLPCIGIVNATTPLTMSYEFVFNFEYTPTSGPGNASLLFADPESSQEQTPGTSGTFEQIFSYMKSRGYDVGHGIWEGLRVATIGTVNQEGPRFISANHRSITFKDEL